MSNIIRIKRSTSSNAPTSLQNAELAYSEASNKLYIGVGTGGAGGSATSIIAIGGTGAFLDLTTAASTYAPLASPTFTGTVTIPAGASISGYLTSATAASTYQTISGMSSYLTTSTASTTYAPLASPTFTGTVTIPAGASISGYLTTASAASTYQTISGMSSYLTTANASSTYAPLASPTFTGTVTIPAGASISGYAPLASPTFTGVPAVPTATAGTNTTQIASTAFVSTAISNLVGGAGAALDTLNELAAALGNDASFSTTITTSIGTKLTKSSNLSDLTDASAARTNLGLGTMATQASSNVSITGGSIDGVTIDGGTF